MLEFSSDLFYYQVNLGILEVNLATLTLDKDVDGFNADLNLFPARFHLVSEKTGKTVEYKHWDNLRNHKRGVYGVHYRAVDTLDSFYSYDREPFPHVFIYDGRD